MAEHLGGEPSDQSNALICGPDCEITNPENPMVFNGNIMPRSSVFEHVRSGVARQIASELEIAFVTDDKDVAALLMTAEACVRRIQSGDCEKFLLNTGQYPDQKPGLMSYGLAWRVLNENND